MKPTNQTEAVLNYLKTHVGITSMQAFEKFGVTRLSAKIFNLRKQGYKISSVEKTTKNRYGNTTRYCEYRLVKKAS